ncbi:peptide ABC transporter ATP-binding protein [Candidatus Epulonipiscium fishelsonii]|nr:peptide ABC transporter ATP-binding protein [Epulopiscium sp. SCG-C06WGA-EpuloA1]
MDEFIKAQNLFKYFDTPRGALHAVDDVSFTIKRGQTLGVVGESGCGKSTLGRTMLRLLDITDGSIFFEGEDITRYSKKQLHNFRKEAQLIFQDPYASLNPRLTVSEIIAEPLIVNKKYKNRNELDKAVFSMMEKVGLSSKLVNTYPHELDGGRRQRIGVARALVLNPKFVVCDEPVSALDVSIQAQILNLLMDMQEEMQLTYMFITHDLSVVKHISDEIAVMYLGKMVEKAPSKSLFENPKHPYTKALLSAIPLPDLSRRGKKIELLKGEVSNPIEPPISCRFVSRCPIAKEECSRNNMELRKCGDDHFVACDYAF